MGWGNKAIEIRSAETGHLDGVFMHKKEQRLKYLCERNDKVGTQVFLVWVGFCRCKYWVLLEEVVIKLMKERVFKWWVKGLDAGWILLLVDGVIKKVAGCGWTILSSFA